MASIELFHPRGPLPLFEQTFKNIGDVLWKDAGCTSELDYTEQSSWILFLKYLDALERDQATGANTIEYKIGDIFGEIKNKIQSGYNLREIIDHIDQLRFGSQAEKHELSHLYEAKIRNMGNAGRNGGEYYTPRPLIRAIIKVVQPRIGERIYDGACGSAGFLCEAFEYLKQKPQLTTADVKILQEQTFFGKEKKSLAYVIAIMNRTDRPGLFFTLSQKSDYCPLFQGNRSG
ncbi:N-6 DNA methylase [Pelovirga terrestris]|uniref:N-6 DNA methylase n=1 Tax=Pelovirga terrestris TaxID=2771352 RepID=UPI001CD0C649|nr:N-6 DNA methylase [Pelovirga terrestris]